MNNIWYKIVLLAFLLVLILAPFAGFAPLMAIALIAGVYWFVSSIVRVLVFGESEKEYQE